VITVEDGAAPIAGKRGRQQRYRSTHNRKPEYRKFLAWDGEGVTGADGVHRYVLLSHSEGEYIVDPDGLSTERIIRFLLDTAKQYPRRLHIIYGGGYDFNLWMRSLDKHEVSQIYKLGKVRLGKTSWWWRPGKSLRIARGDDSILVYDVLSFFQCSFVAACDAYLGNDWEERERIVAEKMRRSAFTMAGLDSILVYNAAELRNLIRLANELRDRLAKVGLIPGRWDGPGAIAATLMRKRDVKHGLSRDNPLPDGAAQAGRIAYAGGRFEVIHYGSVIARAWEGDINSAYPYALQYVPCLAHGEWVHHSGDPGVRPFALYRIQHQGCSDWIPAPLWRRNSNGSICYPIESTGWFWTPERVVAEEYFRREDGRMRILECWEWVPSGCDNPRPFGWIPEYYDLRRALKASGDGAHVGVKLGLNSLYGKLAQQVGWDPIKNRIPPYHQLEWAGYVTSSCRAQVLRGALPTLKDVIAFETDAVFSRVPLQVTVGTGLGEWEETAFSSLAYTQSGMYFGTTIAGKEVSKTRGVDRGQLTRSVVETGMIGDGYADATLTRFVGAGLALAQSWDKWCSWDTMKKRVACGPYSGKRLHEDCPHCSGPFTLGTWHSTYCPISGPGESSEYPVLWCNPDPKMDELEELRRSKYEAWDGYE
jgi:hypothetical protein